jgi:hypothetical protein
LELRFQTQCLRSQKVPDILNRERFALLAMNHRVAVGTDDAEIYLRIDPNRSAFGNRLIVVDVNEAFAQWAVAFLEIEIAGHAPEPVASKRLLPVDWKTFVVV